MYRSRGGVAPAPSCVLFGQERGTHYLAFYDQTEVPSKVCEHEIAWIPWEGRRVTSRISPPLHSPPPTREKPFMNRPASSRQRGANARPTYLDALRSPWQHQSQTSTWQLGAGPLLVDTPLCLCHTVDWHRIDQALPTGEHVTTLLGNFFFRTVMCANFSARFARRCNGSGKHL